MKRSMTISLRDLYLLLIDDCRYGYTRNNHLMPSGAFDSVKKYIPKMYDANPEYSLNTIKQICEECISSQLDLHFYDGEDDDCGNRKESINFIKWCLDWIHENDNKGKEWLPYNYENFLENLSKDDDPRYNIYEIQGTDKVLLTMKPVSQNDYLEFILTYLNTKTAEYRKEIVRFDSSNTCNNKWNYIYHFIIPAERDFYIEHIKENNND